MAHQLILMARQCLLDNAFQLARDEDHVAHIGYTKSLCINALCCFEANETTANSLQAATVVLI